MYITHENDIYDQQSHRRIDWALRTGEEGSERTLGKTGSDHRLTHKKSDNDHRNRRDFTPKKLSVDRKSRITSRYLGNPIGTALVKISRTK
jgi:hypothetical protein